MTPFVEWEERKPALRAPTADAIGVTTRHVSRLRLGRRPGRTLELLMVAIDRLRAHGEAWPPEDPGPE